MAPKRTRKAVATKAAENAIEPVASSTNDNGVEVKSLIKRAAPATQRTKKQTPSAENGSAFQINEATETDKSRRQAKVDDESSEPPPNKTRSARGRANAAKEVTEPQKPPTKARSVRKPVVSTDEVKNEENGEDAQSNNVEVEAAAPTKRSANAKVAQKTEPAVKPKRGKQNEIQSNAAPSEAAPSKAPAKKAPVKKAAAEPAPKSKPNKRKQAIEPEANESAAESEEDDGPSKRKKQTAKTAAKPKAETVKPPPKAVKSKATVNAETVKAPAKVEEAKAPAKVEEAKAPAKAKAAKAPPKAEKSKAPARGKQGKTEEDEAVENETEEVDGGGSSKNASKKIIATQLASKTTARKAVGEEAEDSASSDESEDNIEVLKPRTAKAPKKQNVPITKRTNKAEVDETRVTKRKKLSPTQEKPLLNKIETNFASIDFETQKEHTLKICSWNVAGLRALVNKRGYEYFDHEKPDIICLQEIKCKEDQVPDEMKLKDYHPYWCSTEGGRGGVALLSRKMPYNVDFNIGDAEMDEEGRIITADYTKFYLVCVYVPNAGRRLVNLERRLRWNKLFEAHVNKLKQSKPVIICGDMNVSHHEIDLANPKANVKNAGFSAEERAGMDNLLGHGFIDTFRHLYPTDEKAYSFWTYMGSARSKNVGWRLDYSIVSENLVGKVADSFMRAQVLGSDHCPIILTLNI